MGVLQKPASRPGRDVMINVRAQQRQRDLIDRAAETLGKSRSDFLLETACREAEEVLLDRRMLFMDEAAFRRFASIVNRPGRKNERLRALLAEKAPWEK